MSALAVVVLFVAVAIIVIRGPLAFAPDETVERLRRWFFSSDARMRLMGLGMVAMMAAPLVLASRINPPAHSSVPWFEALGWLAGAGGLLVALLPGPMRRWLEGLFTGMSPTVLRVVGATNIAFGLFLVWVAVMVL